ncbi:hypothetical protein GPECTOR_89g507 [Gonium pectorale]|uniref:RNA helicase n=1 Tax=Gonium pectorale TaxID=33097 RepID=A0A150G0X3_GONPE|nr:hypothetical protein GPECTOR_89g507 [Gonium pectorale]|eukprot:KXZ43487.1 hypothetical protein GPECTOR_89g507 [Gonium pectorale]
MAIEPTAAALPPGSGSGSSSGFDDALSSEGLRRRPRGGNRPAGSGDAPDAGPASGSGTPGGGGAAVGRSSLELLAANLDSVTDTNALQTALAAAISLEDFALAAAFRDRLRSVEGGLLAAGRIDWAATGLPDWLADRVRRLGFRFPTEVQRRAAPVLLSGSDAVIRSATGSGKTLSFLAPLLGRLTYPPEIFLDELKASASTMVVGKLGGAG